ncbi:MAG: sigma-70 family RNA polymerase sigma factor [Planctomycetota bacterium]|nr:MAG: sigma-70 family RNA polymerase sigma factor [Planctomycetota bacterium]
MDHVPFDGKGRHFPETHWSQLLELGDPANPNYAPNLDRLIHQYWMPVYHYVRSLRPVAIPEAEDLTQQFFTMLLDRGSLAKLAPGRGSFRGFLKTALRYFLIDQDRSAMARAPRDGARFFPFEQAEAAWKDARTGVPVTAPEDAFDREWARGVLLEAVLKLKTSLLAEGKERYYAVFAEFWNDRPIEEDSRKSSYAQLARKYSITESDIGNYLRVVRERLRSILKGIVTGYLGPGENVEDEVRFILSR